MRFVNAEYDVNNYCIITLLLPEVSNQNVVPVNRNNNLIKLSIMLTRPFQNIINDYLRENNIRKHSNSARNYACLLQFKRVSWSSSH